MSYNNFGTLATDGYFLYVDPVGLIHEWSDEELESVIIHEISHCIFGHYWRCGNRNARVWNLATDYVINWIITNNMNLKLPTNPACLYDDKYNDQLSAEAIYADLMRDREAAMEMLKNALEDPDFFEECMNAANGEGKGKGDKDGEDKSEGEGGEGQGDGVSVEQLTGGLISSSELRDEQWWQDKVQSARTYSKSQGQMPAYLEQMIGDFMEPKLPWRDILRDFIRNSHNYDYKMLPPHKKFMWMGVALPSINSNHLELSVVLDTSGSISDSAAQQFISETRAIAESFDSFEIHYMLCDADVKYYRVLTNEDEDDWPMDFIGRGGTSFIPPFKRLEEEDYQPPLLIYMTDGYGSFPEEPEYPVLWISDNDNSSYPWGDVLVIDIHDERN